MKIELAIFITFNFNEIYFTFIYEELCLTCEKVSILTFMFTLIDIKFIT